MQSAPATLRKLTKLHYVVFSENRLKDTDWEHFCNLSEIDTLLLDRNDFTTCNGDILKSNATLKLLDIRKNDKMTLLPAEFHLHSASYHDCPSEILPGELYLGNVGGSESLAMLKELKVTHILRAIDVTAQAKQPFSDEEFKYLWIDCVDTDGQDMAQFFDQTNEFLNQEGVKFVHCRQVTFYLSVHIIGFS